MGARIERVARAASGKRHGLTDQQIAALKEPGGKHAAVFGPVEQALLRFTDLLLSYPGNIEPGDLDALAVHFTEEQIIELVLVIATAGWTNRMNDGLQTPL